MWWRRESEVNPAWSVLAGAVAGVVSTALTPAVSALVGRLQRPRYREWEARMSTAPPALVLVQRMGETAGLELTPRTQAQAGVVAHWSYGALCGAAYALLRRQRSGTSVLNGLLFGASLWLLVDELLESVLHLTPPPEAFPISTHAKGFAAHLAYGATTDVVLRGVQRGLSAYLS